VKKFKLATIGCSHSSYYGGTSWPVPLAEELNSELTMAYSSGAGNEMNVHKLKLLLDKDAHDLLVVQLTDPLRFTIGLDFLSCENAIKDNKVYREYLIGNQNTDEDVIHYTFNHNENVRNLERILGRRFHPDVDKLIIKHVITSEYNLNQKMLHTMLAMESLAKSYNVPIVFFAWTLDLNQYIDKQGYKEAFKNFNIIPGYIEEFARKHEIKCIAHGQPAAGHYGTSGHQRFALEYVLPYLKLKQLVPNFR
jgi:hypothetical protein